MTMTDQDLERLYRAPAYDPDAYEPCHLRSVVWWGMVAFAIADIACWGLGIAWVVRKLWQ